MKDSFSWWDDSYAPTAETVELEGLVLYWQKPADGYDPEIHAGITFFVDVTL